MKTLADFKRALTVGAKVRTLFLKPAPLSAEKSWIKASERNGKFCTYRDSIVKDVGTGRVSFVPEECPSATPSWFYFPKAGDIRFDGTSAIVQCDGVDWLIYQFKINP